MYKEMLYNDLSTFLSLHFPFKVQKISINAGFTCPNRDGSIGYGGCTYCNNQTFNPAYCHTDKSVGQQLEEGKRFFSRKYPDMKYLAYFQAYTNTYGELEELKHKYEEALTVADVVGLVIGTRPDCMPDDLLDYLEELNKRIFVLIEYGIESTDDETLKRINRCCENGAKRNTGRWACDIGVAGRGEGGFDKTSGTTFTSATYYAEIASIAVDKRYADGK